MAEANTRTMKYGGYFRRRSDQEDERRARSDHATDLPSVPFERAAPRHSGQRVPHLD